MQFGTSWGVADISAFEEIPPHTPSTTAHVQIAHSVGSGNSALTVSPA